MSNNPDITILFLDQDGKTFASTIKPRKFIIKSGFGAMPQRCWLELFNQDLHISAQLGDIIEIYLNGQRRFRGRIQEQRIDSIDDYISFYAQNDPMLEYNLLVHQGFENNSVAEILDNIVPAVGLSRVESFYNITRFQRLEFSGENLFSVIDLLAKLAGNWYWDILEGGKLSFRPQETYPDHQITLHNDQDTVNIRETSKDAYAYVELYGGVYGGSTYDQLIEIPSRINASLKNSTRIYVRSIVSLDAYAALRRSIEQQMSMPHYEHYVDFAGDNTPVFAGHTVRFNIKNLPVFPHNQIFRIKLHEITYSHEIIRTRLQLTSGAESSTPYFDYFRTDRPTIALQMQGQSGQFRLDVSALDSLSHLDASI